MLNNSPFLYSRILVTPWPFSIFSKLRTIVVSSLSDSPKNFCIFLVFVKSAIFNKNPISHRLAKLNCGWSNSSTFCANKITETPLERICSKICCNTNFALLALLIESISRKKYATYLQQTFFAPLQMKNTFVYNNTDSLKVPLSYDWKGRLIP